MAFSRVAEGSGSLRLSANTPQGANEDHASPNLLPQTWPGEPPDGHGRQPLLPLASMAGPGVDIIPGDLGPPTPPSEKLEFKVTKPASNPKGWRKLGFKKRGLSDFLSLSFFKRGQKCQIL